MVAMRDGDVAIPEFSTPRQRTLLDGFRRWLAIIGALIVREIMSYGERQWPVFTLFLLILEPIGVILIFGAISYFMLRQPVYGTSTILFHATGILPYYYYMRISAKTRRFSAERDNRLPCIHPIDEFLTLVILEYIIMSVATVVVLSAMAYYVTPLALPFNPLACLASVTLITIFACGINLVNSAISDFSDVWVTVLIIANRGMMPIAGVFFVMDFIPPPIRWWLSLNPLSHAIIWFRAGVFPRYPDYSLDKTYLVACAMIALVVGFIVERAVRNIEAPGDRS